MHIFYFFKGQMLNTGIFLPFGHKKNPRLRGDEKYVCFYWISSVATALFVSNNTPISKYVCATLKSTVLSLGNK